MNLEYTPFNDHLYLEYFYPKIALDYPQVYSSILKPKRENVSKDSKQDVKSEIPAEILSNTSEDKPKIKQNSSQQSTSNTKVASEYSPVYTNRNGVKTRDSKNNKVNFIKTFLPIYRKVLKEKGIPEQFAESLVAQAALESSWGYKPIGHHEIVTNNYIGVKVPSRLRGKGVGQSSKTHEEINGKMVPITDEFMVFKSLEDMAKHHIDLLSKKRYQAFSGSVDEFADRVKRGGYATASEYAPYLNKMIASVRNANISTMQKGGSIKPNFINRLEDPNRKSIPDWESFSRKPLFNNRGEFTNNYVDDLINSQYPSISTHKMGYEYAPDDTGRAIVYPEVQEVNGKLVDFTRPPYHNWAGYDSALDRGDYLMMKNLEEARKWVEGYKDRYKNLK